ncbi:MAG: peptidase M14 [Gammaproteobacteria bacterium HGW-Gammaproteobacteria-3]|nr:MAG: peptidase M14 [Gammaproteobacteria bacterium HGW-Gammaproteobacteria-3]
MDDQLKTAQLAQPDALPDGLLDAKPSEIHDLLTRPTLVHLPGKQAAPLFISVMLHGNEPVGLLALQALLKKYQGQTLPRALSIFFGNTEAAVRCLRRLEHQPDFNRIWPGTDLPPSPETFMAEQIVNTMAYRKVFASIDIHSNTGLNPHYACINKLDDRFLQLASLFGRLVVYFIRPKGVQSAAFAKICPAVTLECGRPGQQNGVQHALDFIDTCLHLTEFSKHPVRHQDIDLYHTVAQVKIADAISFSFEQTHADLLLDKDLERMNFNEIPAGTFWGKVNNTQTLPLLALDETGQDVSTDFFSIQHDELLINRNTMPSMLTLDERVIRQDCLCYLMERVQQ